MSSMIGMAKRSAFEPWTPRKRRQTGRDQFVRLYAGRRGMSISARHALEQRDAALTKTLSRLERFMRQHDVRLEVRPAGIPLPSPAPPNPLSRAPRHGAGPASARSAPVGAAR